MNRRRPTKPVYLGELKIGGGADVAVQSMTKTDTRDVDATVRQILELEEAGCDVIRSAVRTWKPRRPWAKSRSGSTSP